MPKGKSKDKGDGGRRGSNSGRRGSSGNGKRSTKIASASTSSDKSSVASSSFAGSPKFESRASETSSEITVVG